MADNTPRGDHPNEPLSIYDTLPPPIRLVIREADDEWACGPLVNHYRLSGMKPEQYAIWLKGRLEK